MSGFRVVGSKVVAVAGFLTITERTIAGPDGDEFGRIVVHHPGAVTITPIDGDDVIFVRQYRAAADAHLLELPAGTRDVDGEAPETTAARELEEEIGHRAGRIVQLAEFYNTPGFSDEYMHLFIATDLEDLGANNAMGPEERAMSIERVPLDRIDEVIAGGELRDAKSIIGVLLARRFLDAEG